MNGGVFAICIGVGVAIGAAIGESRIGAAAMDAMARQPDEVRHHTAARRRHEAAGFVRELPRVSQLSPTSPFSTSSIPLSTTSRLFTFGRRTSITSSPSFCGEAKTLCIPISISAFVRCVSNSCPCMDFLRL